MIPTPCYSHRDVQLDGRQVAAAAVERPGLGWVCPHPLAVLARTRRDRAPGAPVGGAAWPVAATCHSRVLHDVIACEIAHDGRLVAPRPAGWVTVPIFLY